MRNLITLLSAVVLSIIGHVVSRAEVITDPSQLSNTKVYTINTARGYFTLDLTETKAVASHLRDSGAETETFIENEQALQDEESRQFGILNIDGLFYIYNLKLKKFARLHDQTLEFYPCAGNGFAFTTDGLEGAPLRIRMPMWGDNGYSKYFLNNNGGGAWVLNKYNAVDAGNSLMIEEVEGKTLDLDEAMSVFNAKNDRIDPHCVYYISAKRISDWAVATNGINIVGTIDGTGSNPTAADVDKQWAFYRDGAKTYLFSVGMKKFVDKNGQLTTSKDEFANVDFIYSNDATYPFLLYIVDNGKWFNGQGNGGMVINYWNSNYDDGNRVDIVEVSGEDAYDDMQAFFETPSWDITYRLFFEGEEVATAVRNMTLGTEAELPANMIYGSCEYEYSPEIIQDGSDVRVDVMWLGPFEFSKSYEDATWYNMLFNRENEGRDGKWYAYWEEGTEPYFPKYNADEATRSAPQCQWAFVGNPYQLKIYNKAAGPDVTLKFEVVRDVKYDRDANAAVLRPGDNYWFAREYNPGPDLNVIDAEEFSLGLNVDGAIYRMNQVGGASEKSYFGLWTGFDQGSGVSVEEVPNIDVTDVFYDVYYDDKLVASDKVIGQEVGALIVDAPASLLRDFVELDFDMNTKVEKDLHVRVDAIWNGPVELAKDFESAHWYDMSVRGNWYVTSDSVNAEGALMTVEANAIGLSEDAYQWSFVGDPWHVQIYNKAKGSSQVYAWTEAAGQNIPVFVDPSTENYWEIRQLSLAEEQYANSFMLTIPSIGWQLNQNGGAGGPLKIWSSTTRADVGSAFTVFGVPTDFAQFVVEEIAPVMEIETTWCNWTDAARAAIGYKPEYKQSCSLEQYKALRNTIQAMKSDINNFLLPETGFYRLLNQWYGEYINMETDLVNGSFDDTTASTVVKLTKVGDRQYTIQTQNEYFQPLVRSTTMITDPMTPVTFEIFVPEPGYAAFNGTLKPEDESDADAINAYNFAFMHQRQERDLVGWDKGSPASHWQLFDAKTITVKTGANGLTTLYAPFAVQASTGVSPCVGKIESDHLELTGIQGVVPALTPMVIKAEQGDYQLAIVNSDAAPSEGNDLKGELLQSKPAFAMTLEGEGDELAFYTFTGEAIEANKAYLRLEDTSIERFPIHFGDLTGIDTMTSDEATQQMFDLSGRRVNKANKGVYIITGKKMVVK